MNEENESVRLDEILKFSTTVSKGVLLKFLNSIFNEKFELDEVQITVSNNEFITEELEKLRADVFFRIQDVKNFEKTNFHIEFQTLNDKTMVFRMLEYGFKKAVEERNLNKIIFPKQYVIFIEENKRIPDKLELKIQFSNNQIIDYEVPIMKYWQYDDKEIIESKMYPLLPLQLFLLRKELAKNFKNGNLKNKENFIQKIKGRTEKLAKEATELFQKGEILGEDYDKILVMIDYLIQYLNKKYIYDERIEEEIKVLNRTYLDTEAVKIGIEKGMEQGIEKGIEKGIQKGIQKGMEQGERKKQIEIAKNLIVLGLNKEDIAKATGLKLEEIDKLKN